MKKEDLEKLRKTKSKEYMDYFEKYLCWVYDISDERNKAKQRKI